MYMILIMPRLSRILSSLEPTPQRTQYGSASYTSHVASQRSAHELSTPPKTFPLRDDIANNGGIFVPTASAFPDFFSLI